MKTRKMWAEQGVFDGGGNVLCFEHDRTPLYQPRTPVLVTDATDMPEFEPGDRVRTKASLTDVFGSPVALHEYEIAHIYHDGERWCFYSTDRTRHPLAKYEKIPREKTVTLRVTGPDHMVIQSVASYRRNWEDAGVRVERVEDNDE